MAGAFVSALSGLPARIAEAPKDRRRIETITDQVRQELADQFGAMRTELSTGEAA
jgi:hypothetical protein